MKVLIEVDADLWTKFREKVFHCRKTLREVVPTVIEPALKLYLDPHPIPSPYVNKCDKLVDQITEAPGFAKAIVETFHPTLRRCELCDMPTDKVFASGPYKVCYKCWKSASNNAEPSAQTFSSSDAGVPQSKPQQ